jgi:hypothetical protein
MGAADWPTAGCTRGRVVARRPWITSRRLSAGVARSLVSLAMPTSGVSAVRTARS